MKRVRAPARPGGSSRDRGSPAHLGPLDERAADRPGLVVGEYIRFASIGVPRLTDGSRVARATRRGRDDQLGERRPLVAQRSMPASAPARPLPTAPRRGSAACPPGSGDAGRRVVGASIANWSRWPNQPWIGVAGLLVLAPHVQEGRCSRAAVQVLVGAAHGQSTPGAEVDRTAPAECDRSQSTGAGAARRLIGRCRRAPRSGRPRGRAPPARRRRPRTLAPRPRAAGRPPSASKTRSSRPAGGPGRPARSGRSGILGVGDDRYVAVSRTAPPA